MSIRFTSTVVLSGLIAVILATASAAQNRQQPARTLEDLLLQAEADAQPPPIAPNNANPPQQIANEMRKLIAEREAIVNRANLFETLRALRQREPEYFAKVAVVKSTSKNAKAAQNQLNIVAGMARGAGNGGPGPGSDQIAAAQANAANAALALQNAVTAANQFFNEELQPRYRHVGPALPIFFDNYGKMRSLLTLDRNDPARKELLAELESGIQQGNEFVEGHILAGLLYAYDGRNYDAEANFRRASDINEQCGLAFSLLGCDCCYGLLMAGKSGDIPPNYITLLKDLDTKRQTAAICWLVGSHAFSTGKYNEASSFLYKAYKKNEEKASPQLRGEAAWPYLFAENKIDIAKAETLLKGLEAAPAWQVKRAKAGLAAEREQFAKAVALMEGCRGSAPPHFEPELAEQQNAYVAKEVWRRKPKAQ